MCQRYASHGNCWTETGPRSPLRRSLRWRLRYIRGSTKEDYVKRKTSLLLHELGKNKSVNIPGFPDIQRLSAELQSGMQSGDMPSFKVLRTPTLHVKFGFWSEGKRPRPLEQNSRFSIVSIVFSFQACMHMARNLKFEHNCIMFHNVLSRHEQQLAWVHANRGASESCKLALSTLPAGSGHRHFRPPRNVTLTAKHASS